MKLFLKYCLFFIFVVTPSLFYGSCIFPVNILSPHEILIDVSNVKTGVTTKEDVFLSFGDIFKISNDERLFTTIYCKQGTTGWILFIKEGIGFGENGYFEFYEVEIEFDENDVVKRCETFKLPRDKSQKTKSTEIK